MNIVNNLLEKMSVKSTSLLYTIGKFRKILENKGAHLGICLLRHADFKNENEKSLYSEKMLPFFNQSLQKIGIFSNFFGT